VVIICTAFFNLKKPVLFPPVCIYVYRNQLDLCVLSAKLFPYFIAGTLNAVAIRKEILPQKYENKFWYSVNLEVPLILGPHASRALQGL
jgi:hypothetical protein